MYPDLSYLLNDLIGTDVDNWTSIFKTFGLLLVLALISCGVLLKSELKRLESLGLIVPIQKTVQSNEENTLIDTIVNSAFILFFGAKIPTIISDINVIKGDPASFVFSMQGNWFIGIFLALLYLVYNLYNRKKTSAEPTYVNVLQYPSQKTNDIIILAGVSGVIGSKLFSVFEDFNGFLQHPLDSLLAGSGLNVYGGLILAFFTVYWYVQKIGIKPIYMMDIAGMGILLGYGIGRIGCQLSGDGDWGIVAAMQPEWWFLPDWIWSYAYPNNVSNDGILLSDCNVELFDKARMARMSVEDSCLQSCGIRYCHILEPKVYPTPIYETVLSFIALSILWFNRHKFTIPGTIFFIYMIYNGIERFLIEIIRVNVKYQYLGLNLSQAQYISILFVLIGFGGLFWVHKKAKSTNPKV